MRILLASIGSRGDVQPALALGVALKAAGHAVIVGAPPDFEAWAQGLGLEFASSGHSMQSLIEENKAALTNPLRIGKAIREVLLEHVPPMMARTRAAAEGVDMIVSANHFFARSIAEQRRIPFAAVMYAPTLMRSEYHPPMIGLWQGSPRWVNRIRWRLVNRLANPIFMEPINRERAKMGLPPATNYEEHVCAGVPYMLACDAVVGPAPPDWVGRFDVTVTGPWFYDDPAPLDPEVEAFLDAGPPPVYVGFGSMPSDDAAKATREIVAGASASGRRVLLSAGWAGLGEGEMPANVLAVTGAMPHAKLFPRVAAVVHHGGSGTTSAALRAGAPQVIVPHLLDQFYFAHRLEVLGIAPRAVPVRKLDAKRLAAAVDAAIALPPAPRLEARERLRPADGVQRAAQLVESVGAGTRSPGKAVSAAPALSPA
jgi:vancomycin aglycone glucosyltransferase